MMVGSRGGPAPRDTGAATYAARQARRVRCPRDAHVDCRCSTVIDPLTARSGWHRQSAEPAEPQSQPGRTGGTGREPDPLTTPRSTDVVAAVDRPNDVVENGGSHRGSPSPRPSGNDSTQRDRTASPVTTPRTNDPGEVDRDRSPRQRAASVRARITLSRTSRHTPHRTPPATATAMNTPAHRTSPRRRARSSRRA